ncbi:endonuclease domain-containing protein [Kocuria sp. LUK]|uniref:endonuclease domain-containing protein n=1 Tax=Kocuria sp. LUK TaxID=2897828 RepID=UPI001E2F30F1|nr:endonuclease domain-containing protein [Kocuria sp. LUK]MCD1145889.1 endonuclease domain-containing protein [Kocuria sp. LUK]
MTPARTALDCARFLPTAGALTVVDHALALGVDREGLVGRCRELAGRRGVRRARFVLSVADPRAESAGETLTRLVILRAGLPLPELQHEIRTVRGTFRPDFAWPSARVALEFDGAVEYSGRYGAAPEVVVAERQREKELTNLGRRVLRTDWTTVTRRPEAPAGLMRRELSGSHPLWDASDPGRVG